MLWDLQLEAELENSPGEKRQLDRSQSLGHLCRSDGSPLVPIVGRLLHEREVSSLEVAWKPGLKFEKSSCLHLSSQAIALYSSCQTAPEIHKKNDFKANTAELPCCQLYGLQHVSEVRGGGEPNPCGCLRLWALRWGCWPCTSPPGCSPSQTLPKPSRHLPAHRAWQAEMSSP